MPAAIRLATSLDTDALKAIEDRVFPGDRLSRRSFARLIATPSATVLVAGVDGDIAGYAIVLFRSGASAARLYSIAATVTGVGSALLGAAESAVLARGCKSLRLEVRADNARTIALYRRRGYAQCGERPGYYEDGERALRFEKLLHGSVGAPRGSGVTTAGSSLS